MDAASLADTGILFPANPAGVVTVGVTALADSGPATRVVADLADAGITFPDDHAGSVAVVLAGILFPADLAGWVGHRRCG